MAVASGARLSVTSTGLWLIAALAGITRLPATLRVPPSDGADRASLSATHPGMEVLQQAGIWTEAGLDGDVEQWMVTLARPDIRVDVEVDVPSVMSTRLLGPAPVFRPSHDEATIRQNSTAAIAAYEELQRWRADQPAKRVATLCRRDGVWVAAARMWQPGATSSDGQDHEELDEIVVSLVGDQPIAATVAELLGKAEPAAFEGMSIQSSVLNDVVGQWQHDPETNIVAVLVNHGLTVEQARIVEAVADRSAVRSTVTAMQMRPGRGDWAQLTMTIADTIYGRVVRSETGSGGDLWTLMMPGTERRIRAAFDGVLESLPSGQGWSDYTR
ncbi:ESX secretion-associated protein EspG [Mycobacteroides chelonae]|uniref:ESX secretion-associated protein EspG n=1 Tax=Mycobacteroides chelonae TaxID=1774 RepID=UPI001C2C0A24|nr:ESX secretion-associated protein EspG [Mycobacteroides chelonae]MBV0920417.1 ESX secretion-associated protein EspG [Mycobacteroides chelonae]